MVSPVSWTITQPDVEDFEIEVRPTIRIAKRPVRGIRSFVLGLASLAAAATAIGVGVGGGSGKAAVDRVNPGSYLQLPAAERLDLIERLRSGGGSALVTQSFNSAFERFKADAWDD